MEGIKITENLRQVRLKNSEIELFKQSFVIVPYKVSGFLDYTNRGFVNETVNPNDFETFKRIWTGNDSCTITWKDSFKLIQNNETKEMEQQWSLGEVFLGEIQTNEFLNDIATDNSFSEYKAQQQVNSIKFRVHKFFEISDYYNFMFFKIPEISGSTLYRIDNIEKDFAGTELLGYVITFRTINQELSNTGRAKQQNIMPCAPGQGYLECIVKDKNWPKEIGEEIFNSLVPGVDYYAFYDRYITADFKKTLNNPVKKVVVKALGNGVISSFSMTGRPASYNSREFKASRKLFCTNFVPPTTPNIYRSQSSVQNYYASKFGMTLQYYKELFTYLKDTISNINKFNYQGWITYLDNIKQTNNEEGFYSDWYFNIGEQEFDNLYTPGVAGVYKTKGLRNVDNFFFDNYWTTKNVKIAPLNELSTLDCGSTIFGGAGLALTSAFSYNLSGFFSGLMLSYVGLIGLTINKIRLSKFKGISGITPKDIIDFNEGLYSSSNRVPFNLYDNSTESEAPSEVFFKSDTINMSFEADITDSFVSDRVPDKVMNTSNIGQTQFENGDYILQDQSKFLLNGDATLTATKENGFIIDSFQFCGIFNGDISVEFLDSNGDTVWSGVYQSEAKWTKNQREIWTEKNVSIWGRENLYLYEPVPYPKPIQEPPEVVYQKEAIIGGHFYENKGDTNYPIKNLPWVQFKNWTQNEFLVIRVFYLYLFNQYFTTPNTFTMETNLKWSEIQNYKRIKFSIVQRFITEKYYVDFSSYETRAIEEEELWNQYFDINHIQQGKEETFTFDLQNYGKSLGYRLLSRHMYEHFWSTLPYTNLTFTFLNTQTEEDTVNILFNGVKTQLNESDLEQGLRTFDLYGEEGIVFGESWEKYQSFIRPNGFLDTRIYFKIYFEE